MNSEHQTINPNPINYSSCSEALCYIRDSLLRLSLHPILFIFFFSRFYITIATQSIRTEYMSQVKTLLKEARLALSKEDYTTASEFAQEVLELDPKNYYGYNFTLFPTLADLETFCN